MGYVTGFTTRKKKERRSQEERVLRLKARMGMADVSIDADRPKRKQNLDELSQGIRKRVKHKSRNIRKKRSTRSYQDSRGGNDRPRKRKIKK